MVENSEQHGSGVERVHAGWGPSTSSGTQRRQGRGGTLRQAQGPSSDRGAALRLAALAQEPGDGAGPFVSLRSLRNRSVNGTGRLEKSTGPASSTALHLAARSRRGSQA